MSPLKRRLLNHLCDEPLTLRMLAEREGLLRRASPTDGMSPRHLSQSLDAMRAEGFVARHGDFYAITFEGLRSLMNSERGQEQQRS